MKHHVILTAYNRPQMLSVCLDRLHDCHGIDAARVVVSEDKYGTKSNQARMDYVTEKARCYGFEHVKRTHTGPVWTNVFKCLHEAVDTDADLIHIIEDDAFVQPDFLQWSETVQKFEPWVVCAVNEWTKPDESNLVGLSYSDFSSRAFSMRRDNIAALLREDRIYERHVEEVVHRRLIHDKKLMLFPLLPRAKSIQTGGVNLGTGKTITIEKIVEQLGPTNPTVSSEPVIAIDRRDRWERDYEAQKRFGFD